jgi:hypothetical protein
MLESTPLEPDLARELKRDMEAMGTLPSLLECVDIQERYVALDQITLLSRFGPDSDASSSRRAGSFTFGLLPIHFDPVMRQANSWSDRLVKAASMTPFAAREAALAQVSVDAVTANVGVSSRQQALRILTTLMIHDMRSQFRTRDYAQQQMNLVLAGLDAAARFTIASKSEAIKEWLHTLPPDVFRGDPLELSLITSPNEQTHLFLGCAGPMPLPLQSFKLNGTDLSSKPQQRDFFIKVRLH